METRIVYPARTHALTVSVSSLYYLLSDLITNNFIELDLPEYESYEDLRSRLYTAMTAGSEYFGFA